jgi:hypothetical protein
MSYGFDLVKLPSGVDPNVAYQQWKDQHVDVELNAGPIDPKVEAEKQRLAAALIARHPNFELFKPDWENVARVHSIDVAEARRQFRHQELNEKRLGVQVQLFDDTAGISSSFDGPPQQCVAALRLVWGCLELLEGEAGFSTYDPQMAKVLDLESDFDLVRRNVCRTDQAAR